MAAPGILLRLLPLIGFLQICQAVIDNRKPEANYVIPIDKTHQAQIYCVSYFAKTIIRKVTGPGAKDYEPLDCQKCKLDHVRYRCCRVVKWEEVAEQPLTLQCTSVILFESNETDPNVPRIHVSVVRKTSQIGDRTYDDAVEGTTRVHADSSQLYYCHNKSDETQLTAGSHIGLGWIRENADEDYPELATAASPGSAYTERAKKYDQVINDNAGNKEDQFNQLYSNKEFANLWISEDKKVELMEHGRRFECNETQYYLEKGSGCLTPSKRALFIMTNCNLVAKIFIVIGVIVLLIISYIVFNLLVWLWNYVWHKSRKNDDDLAVLM